MLARPGWLCVGGGVGLVVAGRLLGLTELYIAGAVLLCLVASCLILELAVQPTVRVQRQVEPARAHVGSVARVELAITNQGAHRSPVVSLRDPVSGTPGAEVLLAPLAAGQTVEAAYQLPTTTRGLVKVGPLTVVSSDPFGLTRVMSGGAGVVELTVLPRVDDVLAPAETIGDDPHGGAPKANRLGRSGEEFHALRPYAVGDDLRRVHWPSTARTDDLMVRQDEVPWQGRITVVVDLRAPAGDPEAVEPVISAAASILEASWRRRDLVRLLTTDGTDSGFAAGHAHFEAVMEHLAVVEASDRRETRVAALATVLDQAAGGGLVVVTASTSDPELSQLVRPRSGFRSATVVRFGGELPPVDLVGSGARVVHVAGTGDFAGTWNRTMTARDSAPVFAR